MTRPCRHISITINETPRTVYQFAANPENLTKWAAGLARSTITRQDDVWIANSPMGQVKVQFAPLNDFGVIDHDVTLATGVIVHNPFRVLKNGDGSEVVFTLYRQSEMSDADFEADANMITKDLKTLKSLLETKNPSR